jgi:Tat protein secretion system quality control protein TatD with DNase activity
MSMNDIIEIDRRAEEKGEGSASYIQQNKQYFAIVYEYVPEAKLELDAVQRQLDFFHHIGFHPCQVMRKENWQGPGILLDFGDYNSPVDPWFAALNAYRPQPTAEIVIDPEAVEARGVELWNKQEELYRQGVRPTKEEKREKKRIEAMENTAELVERGYDAGRRYVSYFERKSRNGVRIEDRPD